MTQVVLIWKSPPLNLISASIYGSGLGMVSVRLSHSIFIAYNSIMKMKTWGIALLIWFILQNERGKVRWAELRVAPERRRSIFHAVRIHFRFYCATHASHKWFLKFMIFSQASYVSCAVVISSVARTSRGKTNVYQPFGDIHDKTANNSSSSIRRALFVNCELCVCLCEE